MKKFIIAFSVLLLCACSAKVTSVLTQADADRGTTKFSNITLASLKEGKVHYENNCGACHALLKPSSREEEVWRRLVPTMVNNANEKAGSEVIDAKKKELILQYVVTMCTVQAK